MLSLSSPIYKSDTISLPTSPGQRVDIERAGVTLIVLLLLRGNIRARDERFPAITYVDCELYTATLPAPGTVPDPYQAVVRGLRQ